MSSKLVTSFDNSFELQNQCNKSRKKKNLCSNYYLKPSGNTMNNFYSINKKLDTVIDDIFKIFIYIFYYEKALSSSKNICFKEYKKYILINPEWLEYYKNVYHYNELYKILEDYSKYNNTLNYNNLDGHIIF